MTPLEFAIKPFKQYADFNGRARRSEYWWYTLLTIIVSILIEVATSDESGASLFGGVWSLATIIPSIAVGVRRMHDVGKSGWFILIPIYNLILACTDGNSGTNEYGPDPKGDGFEDEIENIGRNTDQ